MGAAMFTAEVFSAMYDAVTEARAQVRIEGKTVLPRALCSGVEFVRENSDYGQTQATSDIVRVEAPAVPPGKLNIGDEIEVSGNGGTWVKVRIVGTKTTGAVYAMTLGAVYG